MCANLPCVILRVHVYFSMVVIMHNTQEKANLQKTKVDITKIRKVCAKGNKLCTGKEWRPLAQ